MNEDSTGAQWSEPEIDLILADYLGMPAFDLAGTPYSKTQRNAALQKLIGRSHGSIGYKHQNISAALAHLGLPWISGYKPMANFQRAFIDGIARHQALAEATVEARIDGLRPEGLEEAPKIFLGPPPPLPEPQAVPKALCRLVRLFDPVERDARKRRLGHSGEERALWNERRC